MKRTMYVLPLAICCLAILGATVYGVVAVIQSHKSLLNDADVFFIAASITMQEEKEQVPILVRAEDGEWMIADTLTEEQFRRRAKRERWQFIAQHPVTSLSDDSFLGDINGWRPAHVRVAVGSEQVFVAFGGNIYQIPFEIAANFAPKTDDEFFLELEELVGHKARYALNFDRDKAVQFLNDRRNASEVGGIYGAIASRDPCKLNWMFAEVIQLPVELDGGKRYEMVVRPLNWFSPLEWSDFSQELTVHGYTAAYPNKCEIEIGEMVLFSMLFSSDRNDDEQFDRVYSYALIANAKRKHSPFDPPYQPLPMNQALFDTPTSH